MRAVEIVREEIQRLAMGSEVPIEARRLATKTAARLVRAGRPASARAAVSRQLREVCRAVRLGVPMAFRD